MTKEELVNLTLKQLSDSLASSPHNLRLEDPEVSTGSFPGPTIIWQFKVETKPGYFIQDPLNATRTIIVSFNSIAREIHCHIYFREVNTFNGSIFPDSKVVIKYKEFVPLYLYRSYRKFMELRKALLNRKAEKEYMDYVKKLGDIFPAAHDDDLFK